jgi:serine acetyltransferase
MRHHPKNPHIWNGKIARCLIFLTRHRIPIVSRLYMVLLGCDIGVKLPRDVFLPHPLGIVIRENAEIGADVVIGHQVTLGGRDLLGRAPVLEDGVYVGCGAKILGGVRVGRGATIGANAVVTRDVVPGAVVVDANRVTGTRSHYAMDVTDASDGKPDSPSVAAAREATVERGGVIAGLRGSGKELAYSGDAKSRSLG